MIHPKDKVQAFNMLQDVIIQFSNPQKRSVNETGTCFYNPIDPYLSAGCAIGMYLPEKTCKILDRNGEGSMNISTAMATYPELIPKWMYDMGEPFLMSLQNLHDLSYNWVEGGLSEEGKCRVERICQESGLDFSKLKI